MSVVLNYKVLDYENTAVKLQDQLFTIFNQLYGGNIKEEISDTVGLIAEAAFLDVITTYNAEDFSAKRNEIGYNMFLRAKASLKDYYLTCTSVFIINQEFVASGYASAISEVAAEIQRIEEKNNLLLSEQVIAQTNEALALLDKDIEVTNVRSSDSGHQPGSHLREDQSSQSRRDRRLQHEGARHFGEGEDHHHNARQSHRLELLLSLGTPR